ncbi:glucosamine inositolphosphorylceramide transferase family protein [Sphingobacterium sp. HJSM2_6]|uniref:glucosamine inositolphosphorylceramide transferase family protein n=1 Tax=Sphingobacterium sp. HJSM2_6 TaxID=3366264 RepID=UPI003BF60E31
MLKLVNKLFEKVFMADKWNIGIIEQSATNLIEQRKLKNIVWLKEDNIDYAADPFISDINNQTTIYYEELNFWNGKGKIMMMEGVDFKSKRKVSGIIPSSIHLSYPYLFQLDKELYCIPETSNAKEVGLYNVDFSKPCLLIKNKVLLSGKEYVDSSIIFYNDKYWLFSSISENYNQLYIFYSSSIDGDYQEHKLNPITVEREACRGAGSLFIVDDFIYRPTQNPTKCYGGSIQINKIVVLTETEYKTDPVFEILPDKYYDRGIHHISFSNDTIVVDGKRRIFKFFMPIKKTVKVFRKYMV